MEITNEQLIRFPYSNKFKEVVIKKYPFVIIKQMLNTGNLLLGLLLKRLENDDDLYLFWLEEYCKKFSPLGYYQDFEDPMELEHGKWMDYWAEKIINNTAEKL